MRSPSLEHFYAFIREILGKFISLPPGRGVASSAPPVRPPDTPAVVHGSGAAPPVDGRLREHLKWQRAAIMKHQSL